MSHNLTDVASSEAILAAIAIPIGSLNTLVTLFIIAGVVRFSIKGTLESRIVFEVQSMISSNLAFLIGPYGIFYLDQRIDLGLHTNYAEKYIMYLFIFQRFFNIGSDLLPSLDRCAAVMYPIKYYTRMSNEAAFQIFSIWTFFCIGMTILSWAIEIIPSSLQNLPMAPFYYMTSYKLVLFTSIPFLVVFLIVCTCDVIVLIIAMRHRKRHAKLSPKTSSIQTSGGGKSSFVNHGKWSPKTQTTKITGNCCIKDKSLDIFDFERGLESPNISKWSPKTPTIKISGNSCIKNKSLDIDDIEQGLDSPNIGRSTKDLDITDDLKLTIRCLSLTTFYFVSQLCTFVPGMIFVNKDDDDVEMWERSDQILAFEVRLIIFIFYLLQFLKPVFFLAFDYKLRQNVFERQPRLVV